MHRLLIVDDEPIIVNSIFQLLQQAAHLELEFYRAYNAFEALEQLRKTRIDLVLSDIRMPGMDGLELQKRIATTWPYCKLIFLTGFNEVSYMQEAIRAGGIVDYLLKNEDDALIVRAVERAIAAIERQEGLMDRVQAANAKYEAALSLLQRNALFETKGVTPARRQHALRQADIPLRADAPIWVMTGRIDEWKHERNESDKELLRYACRNMMKEYLDPTACWAAVEYKPDCLAWIVQPREIGEIEEQASEATMRQAWTFLLARMSSIAEAAQEACRKWLQLPISFALSRSACEWGELKERVARLDGLLGRKEFSGTEWLIQEPESGSGRDEREQDGIPAEDAGGQAPRMIRIVQRYIHEHLDQELSLTSLAALVHHSPTYLSRLYKRLTGITLFEYITEQKMTLARRLLTESALKIHEIASAVGYESAPHFTRSFKKYEGCTPQEFRERG